jgi:PAS domain S-box-containing protein
MKPYEWSPWFNLLDESVAFVDKTGTFIQVNDSFVELIGYSHTEIKNKSLKLITHPDDIDSNQKELEKVLSGEVDHYALLKRLIDKFGTVIWVKVLVHPVKNEKGEVEHLFKQVVTIKNGAREQIKKVNNEIRVVETLSIDSFIKKNWWRLMQVIGVMLVAAGGWVYSATTKMYADSARLDRIERQQEQRQQEMERLHEKPNSRKPENRQTNPDNVSP